VEVLADPDAYPPRPQPDEGVTYAAKISKEEARIDFTAPAARVERQVLAFDPAPGAFVEHAGERIKVRAARAEDGAGAPGEVLDDSLLVACGSGAIRLLRVQRAGRGEMDAGELLRGFALPPGTRL
jgi:methionyl-tRNA formyltransferase